MACSIVIPTLLIVCLSYNYNRVSIIRLLRFHLFGWPRLIVHFVLRGRPVFNFIEDLLVGLLCRYNQRNGAGRAPET